MVIGLLGGGRFGTTMMVTSVGGGYKYLISCENYVGQSVNNKQYVINEIDKF